MGKGVHAGGGVVRIVIWLRPEAGYFNSYVTRHKLPICPKCHIVLQLTAPVMKALARGRIGMAV
jgi:hypothetical protein